MARVAEEIRGLLIGGDETRPWKFAKSSGDKLLLRTIHFTLHTTLHCRALETYNFFGAGTRYQIKILPKKKGPTHLESDSNRRRFANTLLATHELHSPKPHCPQHHTLTGLGASL